MRTSKKIYMQSSGADRGNNEYTYSVWFNAPVH
jgi:hypothetical protein